MKKNIVQLACCALIAVGGIQGVSFAAQTTKDSIIATAKQPAQMIIKELQPLLDQWVKLGNSVKATSTAIEAFEFEKLETTWSQDAQKMDEINFKILELSKSLTNTLGGAQKSLSAIGESPENITELLGIKSEYDAMSQNWAKFIMYNKTGIIL